MINNELIEFLIEKALRDASVGTNGIEVRSPLNDWGVLSEFDHDTGNVIVTDEDGGDHEFTANQIELHDFNIGTRFMGRKLK